jgi:hypothetical protein
MAVAVRAGLLANYTEPIVVALALIVGAYIATVAAYVWSISDRGEPRLRWSHDSPALELEGVRCRHVIVRDAA